MRSINIAIADDHSLFRNSLAQFLERFDEFIVPVIAANGAELLAALTDSIDVVLLDLEMPVMDGRNALNCIRKRYGNDVKVIVLSMHPAEVFAKKYRALGANAFLNKSCEPDELIDTILFVEGNNCWEQSCTNKEEVDVHEPLKNELLSVREMEVLQLLCSGNSCPQIAISLSISIRTVEIHKSNIFIKYGVRGLTLMMAHAIRRGDYLLDL